MADDILVCKTSAMIEIDGVPTPVHAGQTRVRRGHPLLERYGDLFEPIQVQYDTRENTSDRTRDTGRADAGGNEPTAAAKRAAKKAAAAVQKKVNPSTATAKGRSQLKKSAVPTPPVANPQAQGLTTEQLKDPGGTTDPDQNPPDQLGEKVEE